MAEEIDNDKARTFSASKSQSKTEIVSFGTARILFWLSAVGILLVALSWWNSEIAHVLLDYLRLLFSWPVIIGLILYYFIRSQGTIISRLITRITKLAFPGGEVTLSPLGYPEPTQQGPKVEAAGVKLQPPGQATEPKMTSPETLKPLEADFNKFLLTSLKRNKFFIEALVNWNWEKLMLGAFALSVKTPPTNTVEQAVAMKTVLGIPEGALNDLRRVEPINLDAALGRSELLDLHNRAEALVIFFMSGLAKLK